MMENQHDTTFELLAILFISHGSSGSHLLFKYPFNDNITKSKKSLIFYLVLFSLI